MDPEACYAQMMDENSDLEERSMRALDLLGWLARGGYAPGEYGATAVAEECENLILTWQQSLQDWM